MPINENCLLYTSAKEAAAKEEGKKKAQEAAAKTKAESGSKAVVGSGAGSSSGNAVVGFASQFVGNPYVYGGNSLTNGIDCCGFTQQIYAAFRVSLPRVDSEQALCGVEIPLSQAKAGDLLCYYGHVGIYNGCLLYTSRCV